jgi:hypothetical protein
VDFFDLSLLEHDITVIKKNTNINRIINFLIISEVYNDCQR